MPKRKIKWEFFLANASFFQLLFLSHGLQWLHKIQRLFYHALAKNATTVNRKRFFLLIFILRWWKLFPQWCLFDDGIKKRRKKKRESSLQGDFEKDNKTSRNDTWMLFMMMLVIIFFPYFFCAAAFECWDFYSWNQSLESVLMLHHDFC